MALSEATVTLNVHDYVGDDFDYRRTKLSAATNIPDATIHDLTTGETRVGSGKASIAADGTATITVWVPGGADSNPASWQTTINLDYADPATATRVTRAFGPFTITADALLTDLVAEQEVPAEYLTTVTTLLDGYVSDAATSADSASSDADRAEVARDDAVDISGISTPDSLVAALIDTAGGPLTQAALAGAIAAGLPIIAFPPPTGVAATDTAACQAVLDSAPASNGAAAFVFRAGTYAITLLKVPAKCTLSGADGQYTTIISVPSSRGSGPTIREKTVGEGNTSGATGIWIRNLLISGQSGCGGGGLSIGNQDPSGPLGTNAGVEKVYVTGFASGDAINIKAAAVTGYDLWGMVSKNGIVISGSGNKWHTVHAEQNTGVDLNAKNDALSDYFGVHLEAIAPTTSTDPSCWIGSGTALHGVDIILGANRQRLLAMDASTEGQSIYGSKLQDNGHTYTAHLFKNEFGGQVVVGVVPYIPLFLCESYGGGTRPVVLYNSGDGRTASWTTQAMSLSDNYNGAAIESGTGAPSGARTKATFYLRSDTTGTSNQRMYVNAGSGSSTWTGIL